MATKPNREIALDAIKRTGSFSEGEKDALINAFRNSMFPGNWSVELPNDGDVLLYDLATDTWTPEPPPGSTFLSLSDTPGAYIGGRTLKVNALATAVEFAVPSIDDFADFDVAGATNGQVLTYNSGNATWEPANSLILSVNGATGAVVLDIDDVTPTTTKGDLLVENGTNVIRLALGTNTHVLTADSAVAAGVKWAAAASGFSDPMTTRGDIIYKNAANTTARLGRGTANQVLTSDGTDLSWEDSVSGTTVFTGLTDTPANYVGHANKFVSVNSGATALEFTSATPVTQVTGTSPVVSSGGTTPAISIPAATASVHGYMTSTFATKLNGIEAGADVTDATNVAAAGAYMKTVTISTSAPSGGANGDVWYQVV